ncbi:MAG TPA: hypothetical protein VF857_07920 [Spirochaetota bacterium]
MNLFDNIPHGRASGIISVVVGIVFISFNVMLLVYREYYYPRLVVGGVVLLIMGATLFVFPGANKTRKEYGGGNIGIRTLWENAPRNHRVIWVSAAISAIVVSIFLLMWMK